jgi:hypothetical protein
VPLVSLRGYLKAITNFLVVYVDLRRYQGLKMNLGQDTTLFAKVVSLFSVIDLPSFQRDLGQVRGFATL